MGPMIEVSVSGSPVGMYIFVQKKNMCLLNMVMSFIILFSTLIFVKISHILQGFYSRCSGYTTKIYFT
jgi:hypothetical protein